MHALPPSGTKNNAKQTPWLLIRGLCRQQQHWGDLPNKLAQALNTCIFGLDLNGTGEHYQKCSSTSVKEMMEQIRHDFINSYSHDISKNKINILAISMGGMIATSWAQYYPDELDSIVIINTSFHNFSPFYQRIKLHCLPLLFIPIISPVLNITTKINERTILKLTSNHWTTLNGKKILKDWQNIALNQPVTKPNMLKQLYAASHFSAPLTAPNVAILILASQQDQLVDSHCSQAIIKQWQCASKFHETAGHDLPLDDPQWLINTLVNWQQERNNK